MPPFRHLAPALLLTLIACSLEPGEEAVPSIDAPGAAGHRYGGSVSMKLDIADADLIQRTCALYVALRSNAWGSMAFGREVDAAMVQWNTCPGGTMVACTVTPTASGDSVVTGIPLH